MNAGAVLNPARDLGPRLAALTVGFNYKTVMQNQYKDDIQEWWLVGIFGPALGGIVGTLLYIFAVGAQLHDEDEDEEPPVVKKPLHQNGTDATDWRSNHFVPKQGAPQQPQAPYAAPHAPVYGDNNNVSNFSRNQGHANGAYLRGPQDHRQGYQ